LRGLEEGALGLGVIEVVEQRQPLVEVALRIGTRRADRMRIRAHAVEELRRAWTLRDDDGNQRRRDTRREPETRGQESPEHGGLLGGDARPLIVMHAVLRLPGFAARRSS